MIQTILGTSWRTSLSAYAGAIFTAILPYLQDGTFNIHKDWKYLVIAAGIAIFGRQVKDANCTGLPNDKPTHDNGETTV